MVDGVRGWLAAGAWIALFAAACSGNDVFGDPSPTGAGGETGTSNGGAGPITTGVGASGGAADAGSGGVGGSSAGGSSAGGSSAGGSSASAGGSPAQCGALTCTAGQACCNGTYCYPVTCGVCCPTGTSSSATTSSGNGGAGGALVCGGQLCQNGWNCCKVQAVEYCTPTACP